MEFQNRLAEYLGPLKISLHKGLDHIVCLSDNLSKAMEIASAPTRRSKSLSKFNIIPGRASLSPNSNVNCTNKRHNDKNLREGIGTHGSSPGTALTPSPVLPFSTNFRPQRSMGPSWATAKVTPMVNGHGIQTKPKLQIPRLNMSQLAEQEDRLLVRPSHTFSNAPSAGAISMNDGDDSEVSMAEDNGEDDQDFSRAHSSSSSNTSPVHVHQEPSDPHVTDQQVISLRTPIPQP